MSLEQRFSRVPAWGIGLIAIVLAGLVGLVVSGSAAAQQPAVCDQYPDLPQCQSPEQGGGGEDDDGDGTDDGLDDDDTGDGLDGDEGTEDSDDDVAGLPGIGTTGGPSGEVGKGELPFTGYPLTPLLLLLLMLLALGLVIRGYLAIRDRLRTAGDGTPTAY